MIDERLPKRLRPAAAGAGAVHRLPARLRRLRLRLRTDRRAGAVLTWAPTAASGIILLAAQFVAVLNSPDRDPRRDGHQLPVEAEARPRPKPKRRHD